MTAGLPPGGPVHDGWTVRRVQGGPVPVLVKVGVASARGSSDNGSSDHGVSFGHTNRTSGWMKLEGATRFLTSRQSVNKLPPWAMAS